MSQKYPWVTRELTIENTCRRGDQLPGVRRVQEWLNLNGFGISVDGDFGSATEKAVFAFQEQKGLTKTGVVDQVVFTGLTEPLRAVLATSEPNGNSLGNLTVAYAAQHLQKHPCEVGGQNRGPWVRVYMEGNEGKDWPWCAGFACFVMRQAAESLKAQLPIKPSFSCDELASRARTAGCFVSGFHLPDNPADAVTPGSLFLVRDTVNDWTHTGIVVAAGKDTFETIEGNTNDAGDREGYEVCRRIRNYKGKDFIRIS